METTGNKISIVHWHDPMELRLFDKPIACVTNNDKILTFKHTDSPCDKGDSEKSMRTWLWRVEKYNIKCWCFLSELIPNE